MTLAHFAVWYKTVTGGEDDETEVTNRHLHISSRKMVWAQLLREAVQEALDTGALEPGEKENHY